MQTPKFAPGKLCFRLMPPRLQRTLYPGAVSCGACGLRKVLCYLHRQGEVLLIYSVPREEAARWGIPVPELFRIAAKNMNLRTPPRLFSGEASGPGGPVY